MNRAPQGAAEGRLPPGLRFLQLLVIALTLSMIVGVITVVAVVVTRFPQGAGAPVLPALPESIVLPEGARPGAVTWAEGWVAVVTDAGEILIYDPASGALRQRVVIEAGPEQPGG